MKSQSCTDVTWAILETVLWIHKRKSVLGEYIEIFRIEEPQCLQPNFQQLPKKKKKKNHSISISYNHIYLSMSIV